MKKTIRQIAIFAFALVAGSAAFAEYSGDLGFRLGYGHDKIKLEVEEISSDDEYGFKTNDFIFGITNYNLWDINNIVAVGFFDGVSVGFGKGEGFFDDKDDLGDYFHFNFDFLIGPAVAFNVADIVRFQLGAGLDVQAAVVLEADDVNYIGVSAGLGVSAGWGIDFMAKFLPKAVFSPYIGINYSNTYGLLTDDERVADTNIPSIKVFVGGGFNF